MVPIYQKKKGVTLATDHKQRTLSVAASRTATYMAELFATIANGFQSLTAVTKELHFRCCSSPKSATGCKVYNREQIFVEKTKSNFDGIDREIYKFRMQKWCKIFKNLCIFLGLTGP